MAEVPGQPSEADLRRLLPEGLPSLRSVEEGLQLPKASDDGTAAREKEWDAKTEWQRLELAGLEQDIRERKAYAGKIYWLVVCWLGVVLSIVGASGVQVYGFCAAHVSGTVLVALIGGTTVNVLGLFVIVANDLFPKRMGLGLAGAS